MLWIDFSRARDFETIGEFKEFLDLLLAERAAAAGFSYEAKGTPEASFGRLLSEIAASGARIALLIDEYDSPLTSHHDSPELFNAAERVLSRFYSTVKSLDGALQFLFITGITRFSHTSIFSAFNSLDDLTYRSRFSTLLGFTEEDLRAFFGEHLRNAAGILRMPENQLLEGLRRHYDGYCFDESLRARVYAPWSVLKFLEAPEAGFKNYWYQSAGRPSALLSVLRASPLLSPDAYSKEIAVFEDRLSSAQDYAHIDPLAIFLQAGYLTLKRRNPDGSFVLDYPNQEVNESIAWLCADELTNGNRTRISENVSVRSVLEKGVLEEAVQLFNRMLNAIDCSRYPVRDESCCLAFLQVLMLGAGLRPEIEVHTARGRSDLEVDAGDVRWVFELKFARDGDDAEALLSEALEQIRSQKYGESSSAKRLKRAALVYSEAERAFVAAREAA